jgi:hypothetical protein
MSVQKIAELHDAKLLSIALDKTEVRMIFETDKTKKVHLNFLNVEQIRVVDFWLENIVSRAQIFEGPDFERATVLGHIEWVLSSTNSKPFLVTEKIQAICTDIELDRHKLFHLDPSVGAEAVIIYEQLQVDLRGEEETG